MRLLSYAQRNVSESEKGFSLPLQKCQNKCHAEVPNHAEGLGGKEALSLNILDYEIMIQRKRSSWVERVTLREVLDKDQVLGASLWASWPLADWMQQGAAAWSSAENLVWPSKEVEVSVPALSSVTVMLILLPPRLAGARVDENKLCLCEQDPLPSQTGELRRWCCGFQCRGAIFQMQRSQWQENPELSKCPRRVEECVILHTTILSSSSAAKKHMCSSLKEFIFRQSKIHHCWVQLLYNCSLSCAGPSKICNKPSRSWNRRWWYLREQQMTGNSPLPPP